MQHNLCGEFLQSKRLSIYAIPTDAIATVAAMCIAEHWYRGFPLASQHRKLTIDDQTEVVRKE